MALQIFISSTIRFLGNTREYLSNSITQLGHKPVLSENDDIGYISGEAFEKACYLNIKPCQVLVAILDEYFGSQSELNSAYSISNMELAEAINQKKQIYVFVKQDLVAIYKKWKDAKRKGKKISAKVADDMYGCDLRILEFLEIIYEKQNTYPIYISSFINSSDIVEAIKKQLSAALATFFMKQQP